MNVFFNYTANFIKTYMTGIFPILLYSCSVVETRHFSQPLVNVQNISKQNKSTYYRINPRLNRFDNKQMPSTFEDSLDNTIISISLENEFTSAIIGPPFIPIIPHKVGYGYPDDKKHPMGNEKDDKIIMNITVIAKGNDIISFTPSSFSIKKSNGSSANAISFFEAGSSNQIKAEQSVQFSSSDNKVERKTWKIVFTPGIHVNDLPTIFLNSLKINNKDFHTEGIAFSHGKRSFYSPFISING
ncbi:hypothetical protein LK994_13300 [Ferruginibacter lapsinanis]|uniref:hypothetical protein n=1 Tax=Ferruginibacter lapsinanis TaxID=563172 RepID=UPI001E29657E|nr:hypothetical protein [Ferruginibacter lapsinanis]UEG49612.1 hypothetical protein LK994_13300 [Ferruginibacter lapsinanis]